MELLNLSNCGNAKEVKQAIAARVLEVPLCDVLSYFRVDYYNVDQIVEFLYASTVSQANGVLYGPGGFGKTEITKKFFEYFKIPVNTIVGYHDMEVEGLLGIPNMKKLMEDSEYVTAFEKSVLSKPGILLLEEFLDVRPSTAAVLKDVLTEGGLRQGDKLIPSLAGQVLICSNKDPEELSVDFSTSAFYKERFPCTLFVAWDSYTKHDYNRLFKIVFDSSYIDNKLEFDVLAGLCSCSSNDSKVLSPRIAISAGNVMLKSGINSLKFVSEIDTSMLDTVKYELSQTKAAKALIELINDIKLEAALIINESATLDQHISIRFWLLKLKDDLKTLRASDEVLEVVGPFMARIDFALKEVSNLIDKPKENYDYNKRLRYAEIHELVNKLSS